MIPVTEWVRHVKQPRGGYLPIKSMHVTEVDDGRTLHPDENLGPGTVGTAVDYLSRVLAGADASEVYALPLAGAEKLGMSARARRYLAEIAMFSDDGEPCEELIRAGVNLGRFDVVFKAGQSKYLGALNGEVAISPETTENIGIMLGRVTAFRGRHGMDASATARWMRYNIPGGLPGTDGMSGEADIVSRDAVWDCKAMKTQLRATYSLQLLAYYVMLWQGSGRDMVECMAQGERNPMVPGPGDFTLGFFNPRTNTEHAIHVSELNPEIFKSVPDDMRNTAYLY